MTFDLWYVLIWLPQRLIGCIVNFVLLWLSWKWKEEVLFFSVLLNIASASWCKLLALGQYPCVKPESHSDHSLWTLKCQLSTLWLVPEEGLKSGLGEELQGQNWRIIEAQIRTALVQGDLLQFSLLAWQPLCQACSPIQALLRTHSQSISRRQVNALQSTLLLQVWYSQQDRALLFRCRPLWVCILIQSCVDHLCNFAPLWKSLALLDYLPHLLVPIRHTPEPMIYWSWAEDIACYSSDAKEQWWLIPRLDQSCTGRQGHWLVNFALRELRWIGQWVPCLCPWIPEASCEAGDTSLWQGLGDSSRNRPESPTLWFILNPSIHWAWPIARNALPGTMLTPLPLLHSVYTAREACAEVMFKTV